MEILVAIVVSFILLVVGFFFGNHREKEHYKSIIAREDKFLNLPTLTMTYKSLAKHSDTSQFKDAKMVSGGVVISIDYFKRFLALLRNFFGGQVSSYETLIDRARREALLRMKEQASDAEMIINVRLETSTISSASSDEESVGSIEAFAYGTALYK